MPAGTTLFDARAGTASRSTRPAAATAPARSARCACRRAAGRLDGRPARVLARRAARRLAARLPRAGEDDLLVEVPPLQTRPKAALAGVGRHVILRPAVQKRHLELDRADARGPASDLERVLAGMDDVELQVPLDVCGRSARMLRGSDWDVTAVFVDDRPDRRRARRHDPPAPCARVRPRHDDGRRDAARSRDRPAGGGALDAEPAAAVRRRRDLADLRDDDRSETRSTACARGRTRRSRS